MNQSISMLKNLWQWSRCKEFDFEISDKLLETGGNYIFLPDQLTSLTIYVSDTLL
jgi:hypothetical protein